MICGVENNFFKFELKLFHLFSSGIIGMVFSKIAEHV